jgi:hypothetical protein
MFKDIKLLREAFPNVPNMVMSATLPPHVMSYVHTMLGLKKPTDLIVANGRRTNINLIVAEQKSQTDFEPLLDLIPEQLERPDSIPPTLIFVDNCRKARIIAIKLRACMQERCPLLDRSKVVRTYYASIDEPKKERTQEYISNGTARFVICTDSLSLGVDFSNIERVIQWGVNEKIIFNTLVQRVGRAARGPDLQGVAIIYVSKDILKAVPKEWEKGWDGSLSNHRWPVEEGDEDWEDCEVDVYQAGELARFSVPVEHSTENKVQELLLHMYRKEYKSSHACPPSRKRQNGAKPAKGKRKKSYQSIDPGVLWFLCTTGCRHRCILRYMGFPDVFDDSAQKSWCCDVCAQRKGLDPQDISTAGIRLAISACFPKPPPPKTQRAPPAIKRASNVKDIPADLIADDIKTWRTSLWVKLNERGRIWDMVPEAVVLPDLVIDYVVANIRDVVTAERLNVVMTRGTWNNLKFSLGPAGLLRAKDVIDLFNIIDYSIARHIENLQSTPRYGPSSLLVPVPVQRGESRRSQPQPRSASSTMLSAQPYRQATASQMLPAESQRRAAAPERIASGRNPLTDITNHAAPMPGMPGIPSANLSIVSSINVTASQHIKNSGPPCRARKRKLFNPTDQNENRKRDGKRVVKASKRLRRANGEPSSTENEESKENKKD